MSVASVSIKLQCFWSWVMLMFLSVMYTCCFAVNVSNRPDIASGVVAIC